MPRWWSYYVDNMTRNTDRVASESLRRSLQRVCGGGELYERWARGDRHNNGRVIWMGPVDDGVDIVLHMATNL